MEDQSKWLFRYTLFVALVVFNGRAMPLGFLPIALEEDFGLSDEWIGMVLAVYPLIAFLSTPWASRLSRGRRRIIRLHSFALFALAAAMLLNALADFIRPFGRLAGSVCVLLSRGTQGIGVSLYLSANTSLVTRMFRDNVPYVIAMTEVVSGIGSQLGRVVGGFLYDLGGFSFPFFIIATIQVSCGLVGLWFQEDDGAPQAEAEPMGRCASGASADNCVSASAPPARPTSVPWGDIMTPRMLLGAVGAFVVYFYSCFLDTVLPQHLEAHLGPIPVSVVSLALSVRTLVYLCSSYICARLMHHNTVSFERLFSCGCILAIVSAFLMAPQHIILDVAFGGVVPTGAAWAIQLFAFACQAAGISCIFVPSLPLMQSEAKCHGEVAVEQVAELFVAMMTLGEMVGPIAGGSLVPFLGFELATLLVDCALLPVLVAALVTYDAAVVRARFAKNGDALLDEGRGSATPIVPTGDFAVRRIPFVLAEKREEADLTWSAPATTWRRAYAGGQQKRVLEQSGQRTAPSHIFRRTYERADAGVQRPQSQNKARSFRSLDQSEKKLEAEKAEGPELNVRRMSK